MKKNKYYALYGKNGFAVVASSWDDAKKVLALLGKAKNSKKFKDAANALIHAQQGYFKANADENINDSAMTDNDPEACYIDIPIDYHVVYSKSGFGVFDDLTKMEKGAKYYGKDAKEIVYNDIHLAKEMGVKLYNDLLDKLGFDLGYFELLPDMVDVNYFYFRKKLSPF